MSHVSSSLEAVNAAGFNSRVIAESEHQPVLVDFWAPWCGPCRAMAPALEALAARHAGEFSVVKLDVDQEPELAAEHRVRAIPTLVVFHRGVEVDRLVGLQSAESILERVRGLPSEV